jgi:hypothetical protein
VGAIVFDPVSLVVAALVRALMAGADELGRSTAHDAYEALKGAIVRKYGRTAETAILALEQQPESVNRQSEVEKVLRRAGAGDDPELANLASALVQVVQEGIWYDPLAQPKRTAGLRAIGEILTAHVQTLNQARAWYSLNDSDLLGSNVSRARNIPDQVRSDLASLHGRIRQIIEQIALQIEGNKYRDTENAIQNLHVRGERERAATLVAADKAIHVSYETLRVAVEFFSELNSTILVQIEKQPPGERQAQMMFGNAVMIFELTDFVINYINTFSLDGLAQLEKIHRDTQQQITATRTEQATLEDRAKSPEIEPTVREGILEDIRNREAAMSLVLSEWDRYISETKQFYARVGDVQNQVPTLEVIRENARLQLSVLEIVAMLRFLKQNSEAVRATVNTLQGLRLAPLTPTRVRQLLNING